MQWLAKIGDELYMLALKANRWLNLWRAKMGWEYWSLSQFLKDRVKNAVAYIDSFETAVASEAQRRGCQAVLCGHIHKAQKRDIDGVTYLNSGDWVESLTALVETETGELKIIHWSIILEPKSKESKQDKSLSQTSLESLKSLKINPPLETIE